MLNSAEVILVCRDVGTSDTFLFGELLEYRIVLEVARQHNEMSVDYCDSR